MTNDQTLDIYPVRLPVTQDLVDDAQFTTNSPAEPPVLPAISREEAEFEVRARAADRETRIEGMTLTEALALMHEMKEANVRVETDNRIAVSRPAETFGDDDPATVLLHTMGMKWQSRTRPVPFPSLHVGSLDGVHYWVACDDSYGEPQTFGDREEWERVKETR